MRHINVIEEEVADFFKSAKDHFSAERLYYIRGCSMD